jgi:transcriptional regulator
MYTPPYFAETRQPVLHTMMRMHPFATLLAATVEHIEAMHVPMLLVENAGACGVLQGHMAKVNPFWKSARPGSEVLAIFQGSNRYISPNWYPSKQQHGKAVPTWNYIVVHARGNVSWNHNPAWLREHLENSTKSYETSDKPWKVSDAPSDYIERMLGGIVGFEIAVSELQGTLKLSQNRSEEDRQGVIDALSSQSNTIAADMVSWINGERDRQ